MTTTRIGLMGFGRIGRNVVRLVHHRDDLEVVAISDIADPEALTYLLKYDSIYGRFPAPASYADGKLTIGSKQAAFLKAKEPGDANWGDLGVDVVLETTSRYRIQGGPRQSSGRRSQEGRARLRAPRRLARSRSSSAGSTTTSSDLSVDIVALGSNTLECGRADPADPRREVRGASAPS